MAHRPRKGARAGRHQQEGEDFLSGSSAFLMEASESTSMSCPVRLGLELVWASSSRSSARTTVLCREEARKGAAGVCPLGKIGRSTRR